MHSYCEQSEAAERAQAPAKQMEQHVQCIVGCYQHLSLQHELRGAEPLPGNSGSEPGSREDAASAYEQWELAAFCITAPSLGLFSQPASMTETRMITLSPPERPVNAAPSITADQAPLMMFVPKDALNLAGMSGDFKKLFTYTNVVSSACNVSCQRFCQRTHCNYVIHDYFSHC